VRTAPSVLVASMPMSSGRVMIVLQMRCHSKPATSRTAFARSGMKASLKTKIPPAQFAHETTTRIPTAEQRARHVHSSRTRVPVRFEEATANARCVSTGMYGIQQMRSVNCSQVFCRVELNAG
jgi:hypothetical protein